MNWEPRNNSLNETVLNQTHYVYRVKCHSCGEKINVGFGPRNVVRFQDFQDYVLNLDNTFFQNCEECEDMTVNSLVAISKSDAPCI